MIGLAAGSVAVGKSTTAPASCGRSSRAGGCAERHDGFVAVGSPRPRPRLPVDEGRAARACRATLFPTSSSAARRVVVELNILQAAKFRAARPSQHLFASTCSSRSTSTPTCRTSAAGPWRPRGRPRSRDPRSYFHRYADLSNDEAEGVATRIWREINEPNLLENILPTRGRAHLILKKGPGPRRPASPIAEVVNELLAEIKLALSEVCRSGVRGTPRPTASSRSTSPRTTTWSAFCHRCPCQPLLCVRPASRRAQPHAEHRPRAEAISETARRRGRRHAVPANADQRGRALCRVLPALPPGPLASRSEPAGLSCCSTSSTTSSSRGRSARPRRPFICGARSVQCPRRFRRRRRGLRDEVAHGVSGGIAESAAAGQRGWKLARAPGGGSAGPARRGALVVCNSAVLSYVSPHGRARRGVAPARGRVGVERGAAASLGSSRSWRRREPSCAFCSGGRDSRTGSETTSSSAWPTPPWSGAGIAADHRGAERNRFRGMGRKLAANFVSTTAPFSRRFTGSRAPRRM